MFSQVLDELHEGSKRTHWIWFIFPQLKGLGHSPTSLFYSLESLEEAEAYERHPLLGPRLFECTRLVNLVKGRNLLQIFGTPDDLKFRSSMTLFARVAEVPTVFQEALKKYFNGEGDPLTLKLLE